MVAVGRGEMAVVATGMRTEFGRISRAGPDGGIRPHAAAGEPRPPGPDPRPGRARGRRAGRRRRAGARPAGHRHVDLRHRPGGRGRARGAAGGGHHLARDRRPANGEAPRAGAPPAGRRDAGQHVGDLLGQDRHADQERDDRPAGVCWRPAHRGVGHRLRAVGRVPAGRPRRSSRPAFVVELLRAASLASDARVVAHEGQWRVEGDPTEGGARRRGGEGRTGPRARRRRAAPVRRRFRLPRSGVR